MKRVLTTVFLSVMAIMVLLPVGIAAATEDEASNAAEEVCRTLAIRAPQVAPAGEKVKMQVIEKNSGEPVAAAGLWAVAVDKVNAAAITSALAAPNTSGILLGWTDREGYIFPVFREAGNYVLVAVKDSCYPGFAGITIKPAVIKSLSIKSPESAVVGETVTMTIYERSSGDVVPQAGVWAIPASAAAPTSNDYEANMAFAEKNGSFLGWTNRLGQVSHRFDRPDRYLLVALKKDYLPGFAKIEVRPVDKGLVIRAPEAARIMQPVPIQVMELSVLPVETPVSGAVVWAVNMKDYATLDGILDNTSLAERYGIYLGKTNERGYVQPTPVFRTPGQYWLIAIKEGYKPGFNRIMIYPLTEEKAEPLPQSQSVKPNLQME